MELIALFALTIIMAHLSDKPRRRGGGGGGQPRPQRTLPPLVEGRPKRDTDEEEAA